jgi:hypothetical protein
MDKRELLRRLYHISEGEVEDGGERVYQTMQLARCAVVERIDTDALAYLMCQLVERVAEERSPGWVVRGMFSLWVLLGNFCDEQFVGVMDGLLNEFWKDLTSPTC